MPVLLTYRPTGRPYQEDTMTVHELAAHYASTGVAHPIDGDRLAEVVRPKR